MESAALSLETLQKPFSIHFRMYQQLNKLKTIKNERFFKFKGHKIKSQDVLQVSKVAMYYGYSRYSQN